MRPRWQYTSEGLAALEVPAQPTARCLSHRASAISDKET